MKTKKKMIVILDKPAIKKLRKHVIKNHKEVIKADFKLFLKMFFYTLISLVLCFGISFVLGF